MTDLDEEKILKLRIAINDASRAAMDEFIRWHIDQHEDLTSVRSPGWYVASCDYWEMGEEECCSWGTSGSEPVVENSVREHVLSHNPVGVGIAQFHREILSNFLRVAENPQRHDDVQLHMYFQIQRELVCQMAEVGYGLRD